MATTKLMPLAVLSLTALLLSLTLFAEGQSINGSQIEGIRLVQSDGTIGGNMGRVEVRYNGVWGTICDDYWYTAEARVACRMLGFEDAICAVRYGQFGRGNFSSPIWMDNVNCVGYEAALDFCYFNGWRVNDCSHYDDAGVVCRDDSSTNQVGIPSNIRLITSSTRSLTIGWTAPAGPSWGSSRRYTIRYESANGIVRTQTYFNSSYYNGTSGVELSYTIGYLTRDMQYSIQIRMDVRNSACGYYYYYYNYGNYSDPVSFRTNATLRQSNIPLRLISPTPGLDYLGRVEVFHNNQWGTICDDSFGSTDANVVCHMLNFTEGALCYVGYARFGRGQGPIWLDNVNCGVGDEVLEDCDHNPWGVHNCGHSEDVGVVCRTNNSRLTTPVMNLTVLYAGPTSIRVGWNEYTFPPGASYTYFQIQYIDSRHYRRTATAFTSQTQYTLRRLRFGEVYNISIRPYFRYSGCYSYIYGEYSNNVTARTVETAPTAAPQNFYVVAINRTAVEAEWNLPVVDDRGGIIRGYKLYYRSTNSGVEQMIDISDNTTDVYVVNGLQPATSYRFSVLAYTNVGDGPRSIHLTIPTLRFDPLITQFGYYGNGVDRITRYASSYSYRYGRVHIHCASSNFTHAPPNWFFSNGSRIGVRDRNFHEGRFSNGTAVLKIADNRPLSYCDGGVYTCRVVNSDSGHSQTKNFTLTINSSPPPPSRPFVVSVQSTSITIGWSGTSCNGGHTVTSFTIRHRRESDSSYNYYYSYSYIRDIDPTRRNYTITGLQSSTYYSISVQSVDLYAVSSSFSLAVSVSTLPPAPSPPRDIVARLVTPLRVEVTWRSPAVSNGAISHYTVYVIPLRSANVITGEHRQQSESSTTPPQTIQMAFPANVRAGNITISAYSITYQFRVSASVSVGHTTNEGELSAISVNSTIFIPKPGLPIPTNFHISKSTNASISLMWNYPPPPSEAIENFLVTYSGHVEWRSPNGVLVMFEDSGETNVTTNRIKIPALVPGTMYQFRVSAITQSGRGAEVILNEQTHDDQVSLAYFQLRMGPVRSCFDFMDFNGGNRDDLKEVRSGLAQEMVHLCSACGITIANIKDDEFSCRHGLTTQIIYRARIVGTETYSAPGLVSLMQTWVASDRASIMVYSSRLHLDPACSTILDTLYAPDCSNGQSPISPPTASPLGHINGGEIGGIAVGAVIVLLLVVLIVVIMLKKWRPKIIRRYGRSRMVNNDNMCDDVPFVDDGSNEDNSPTFDIDNKEI